MSKSLVLTLSPIAFLRFGEVLSQEIAARLLMRYPVDKPASLIAPLFVVASWSSVDQAYLVCASTLADDIADVYASEVSHALTSPQTVSARAKRVRPDVLEAIESARSACTPATPESVYARKAADYLVSQAAEAIERFGDDELEAYAAGIQRLNAIGDFDPSAYTGEDC